MKIHWIAIAIGLMLLTTFFTIAEHPPNDTTNKIQKEHTNIPVNVTVPDWETGDYWSFRIDTIKIDYEDENTTNEFHMTLNTDNITLSVTDDSGDTYVISLNAILHGDGTLYYISDDGPIDMVVTLPEAQLTGSIVFNQSNLGIQQGNIQLTGTLKVKFNQLLSLEFPLPTIPIPATIDTIIESTVPYSVIEFPLNDSMNWSLPATNISVDGTIKSIWLTILYHVNNFLRNHWTLVERIAPLLGIDPLMVQTISDFLANPDILPVVKIGPALDILLNLSIIEIPMLESIFSCLVTETLSVPAGTFSVYNISVADGIGLLYYAPDAGMIIKASGRFNDILPFITDLNAELIAHSYS